MPAIAQKGLEGGFEDAVLESQRVFRLCLQALSRPGVSVPMAAGLKAIGPLRPATAAILLALADFETTVWLDSAARAEPDIGAFLRFHTGAAICDAPDDADFAVVLDPRAMPALAAFKQGTSDYPDRSSTLLIQVDHLRADGPSFTGPGIDGSVSFWTEPLPADFSAQLVRNRKSFPCGVDILFVAPAEIVGLPRSTTTRANGGG